MTVSLAWNLGGHIPAVDMALLVGHHIIYYTMGAYAMVLGNENAY